MAFPRIRGGDPIMAKDEKTFLGLFPAYAGVILIILLEKVVEASFPRIRGGDPNTLGPNWTVSDFSPHMRG